MKVTITNEKLLNADTEFQQLMTTALGMLLMGKIQEFYKQNGERINAIRAKVLKIQKAHLVFEGEQIKMSLALINVPAVPVFLEGKTETELNVAFKALMNETTVVDM